LQLSLNGGPFFDLPDGLLIGQPNGPWLESPTFDLSAYAGQIVRLRFHFDALDEQFNLGAGWLVDDVWVGEVSAPPTCQDPPDWPNPTLTAEICPNGDVDQYPIAGVQGQALLVRSSGLPLQLELLDPQGRLLVTGEGQLFSVLPQDGDYSLRLMAAEHPGVQGSYTLERVVDDRPPTLSWLFPQGSGWVPGTQPFTVAVEAQDGGSGVAGVAFYWRSAAWLNSDWIPLGSDADGSDGWTAWLDPTLLGEMQNSALVAIAADAAGNRHAAWLLWLRVDDQPPQLNLTPLPAASASTAVHLTWQAEDGQTGLAGQELTYRVVPDTAWQSVPLAMQQRSTWWLGQFGQTVEFRLRLWDRAGNLVEQRTQTTIEPTCQPDEGEDGDDLPEGALAAEALSVRNLCGLEDPDWVVFTAPQDGLLLMQALPLDGGAALQLTLFAEDGQTQLKQSRPVGLGSGGWLLWSQANAGQVYRLRLLAADPSLAGSAVTYRLQIYSPRLLFLPSVLNEGGR
jgi:hypothetical protein